MSFATWSGRQQRPSRNLSLLPTCSTLTYFAPLLPGLQLVFDNIHPDNRNRFNKLQSQPVALSSETGVKSIRAPRDFSAKDTATPHRLIPNVRTSLDHPEVDSHLKTTNRAFAFLLFYSQSTLSQRLLPGKQDSLSSPVTRPPRRHNPAACSAQSRDCRKDRFLNPTVFANSTADSRPTSSLDLPHPNRTELPGSVANTIHFPI